MPQLTGMGGPIPSSSVRGPSSDQIVADMIGGDTPYKSVALRVQVDSYRSTTSIRGKMSFDKTGRPIEPKIEPKIAFDSLFSGLSTATAPAPTTGGTTTPVAPSQTAKLAEFAASRRKSILDFIAADTSRLSAKLGSNDRMTMDRYLTELRDLEKRIALTSATGTTGPTGPAGTSAGPAGPGAVACNQLMPPDAIPNAGTGDAGNYSNEDKRAELLCDYTAAVLACNRTRVVTLQFTFVQCFMSMVPINGLKTDLHEAGHAAGGPKDVADGIKWHMKHFARLVSRLKDTRESDGSSLLDNTALLFVFEGGHGFDPDAGNKASSHSSENMMVIYAGHAGGLKGGKNIVATDKHPAQVVLTAMNAVGVQSDKLGEISGPIPEMLR
jgi:hypothetical protein